MKNLPRVFYAFFFFRHGCHAFVGNGQPVTEVFPLEEGLYLDPQQVPLPFYTINTTIILWEIETFSCYLNHGVKIFGNFMNF